MLQYECSDIDLLHICLKMNKFKQKMPNLSVLRVFYISVINCLAKKPILFCVLTFSNLISIIIDIKETLIFSY